METNTALCFQIPGPKVLVWTDWTDLNLRANQNAGRINLSPGIFSMVFQTDFSGMHGVSTEEKKTLLVEHLQT